MLSAIIHNGIDIDTKDKSHYSIVFLQEKRQTAHVISSAKLMWCSIYLGGPVKLELSIKMYDRRYSKKMMKENVPNCSQKNRDSQVSLQETKQQLAGPYK